MWRRRIITTRMISAKFLSSNWQPGWSGFGHPGNPEFRSLKLDVDVDLLGQYVVNDDGANDTGKDFEGGWKDG